MNTRPTCKLNGIKVTIKTEDGRQLTLEPEDCIKLAHELMACGERALKKQKPRKKELC